MGVKSGSWVESAHHCCEPIKREVPGFTGRHVFNKHIHHIQRGTLNFWVLWLRLHQGLMIFFYHQNGLLMFFYHLSQGGLFWKMIAAIPNLGSSWHNQLGHTSSPMDDWSCGFFLIKKKPYYLFQFVSYVPGNSYRHHWKQHLYVSLPEQCSKPLLVVLYRGLYYPVIYIRIIISHYKDPY